MGAELGERGGGDGGGCFFLGMMVLHGYVKIQLSSKVQSSSKRTGLLKMTFPSGASMYRCISAKIFRASESRHMDRVTKLFH